MRQPSLDDLEFILGIVNEHLNTEEPVVLPPRRKLGRLKACLEQPFQSFGGEDYYPTLEDRAAMLFYLIIKNHPLPNANKRVAVVTTTFFLIDNGYMPTWSPRDLYEVATTTADTPASNKDFVVRTLAKMIGRTMKPLGEVELEPPADAA